MATRQNRRGEMINYRVRRNRWKRIRTLVTRLLLLFIAVNVTQQWLLPVVRISGDAMSPTLRARDVVYGSILLYTPAQRSGTERSRDGGGRGRQSLSYGDVISIRVPYEQDRPWHRALLDGAVRFFTFQRVTTFSESRLVRRIIALPGDVVRMRNFQFFISSGQNEEFESELIRSRHPYQLGIDSLPEGWQAYYPLSADFDDYIVPPMSYFVAADNRLGTLDSRVWGGIPVDAVIAPAIIVYRFPFTLRAIRRIALL